MPDLPPIRRSPRQFAVKTIKEWLASGHLGADAPIPPELKLVRMLGVSRTTVRAALAELETSGLIRALENGRRVPASVPQRTGLMQDTLVVVSTPPGQVLREGNQQSGFNVFIEVGVNQAIRRSGRNAFTLKSPDLDPAAVNRLFEGQPLGLVVLRDAFHVFSEAMRRALSDYRVPLVVYGTETEFPQFDTVTSDHEAGAAELTRWLIRRGRRRIQPVWHLDIRHREKPAWLLRREAGYAHAMREASLEPLTPIVMWDLPVTDCTPERFETSTKLAAGYLAPHLLSLPRIDAIMGASDERIFSLAEACRQFGARPHEDIDIVGYDNFWMDYPDRAFTAFRPLVSVDKLNLQIGARLVDTLLDRLANAASTGPQHRLVAPRLVEFSA